MDDIADLSGIKQVDYEVAGFHFYLDWNREKLSQSEIEDFSLAKIGRLEILLRWLELTVSSIKGYAKISIGKRC